MDCIVHGVAKSRNRTERLSLYNNITIPKGRAVDKIKVCAVLVSFSGPFNLASSGF